MNKILLSITGVLLIAVVALVAYDKRPEATITYGTPQQIATSSESTTTVTDVPPPSSHPVLSATASNTGYVPTPTLMPVQSNRSVSNIDTEPVVCKTAMFIVADKTYLPCVTQDITVFDLMQRLTKEGLVFAGREYPSLGFFIESMNGKKAENGYYWFLYFNDASSAEGASTARARPGDRIEWRYKVGY